MEIAQLIAFFATMVMGIGYAIKDKHDRAAYFMVLAVLIRLGLGGLA